MGANTEGNPVDFRCAKGSWGEFCGGEPAPCILGDSCVAPTSHTITQQGRTGMAVKCPDPQGLGGHWEEEGALTRVRVPRAEWEGSPTLPADTLTWARAHIAVRSFPAPRAPRAP